MASRNIPRDHWHEELDSFSRQHEGWIVRVRVTDPQGHQLIEARDLPLRGVSADSPENDSLAVIVGERPDDHLTHEIEHPVDVAIEATDEGAERALTIRSRDGSTTTVEFRTPMRPQDVDGWPRFR